MTRSHSRRLAVRALPALALAVALTGAPAAAASFPTRIDLPDGWQPEGITAGKGTTFYVGSLANGAIWKGDFRTGAGSILVAGVTGRVAVGTEYETEAHRLWVAGGPTGEVRVYNARTGALLQTYAFSAGFLNDLVVTEDAVYVTDSAIQQLLVIPLGEDGALPAPSRAFARPLTGDLQFVTGFNLNGIVASRGWLIVVQSNTGKLFRVNPSTGRTREIRLRGGDAASGDGLQLVGSTLYVVQNFLNRVAVFKLGEHLRTARRVDLLTSAGLDIPATVAFSAGRLWAANARFTTPPGPTVDYWITQLRRDDD